jgi:uncharacterized protein YndB with AHSA1/START domain
MAEFPIAVIDDGPAVRATAMLPGCPPDRVLAAFTDPELLARWWGGDLVSTLEPGTPYTVTFTRLGRAITGEVVAYQPASHLEYTWQWDHEPEAVRRTVLVTVTRDEAGTGTALTIIHGPHGDGAAEVTSRTEHREGWEFFLPRLAAQLS